MGIFDTIFKGKPGNMTQTTGTKLGSEAQSIWGQLFPQIQQQKMPTAWSGPTVAGFDPATVAGQNQVLGAAGAAQPLATQANAAQSYFLDPARLNVTSDPNITRQADAIREITTRNLMENVLPTARGGEIANSGMYAGGASKAAQLQGKAIGDTNANLENTLAGLFSNAYQQAASRQQHAVDTNDSVMRSGATPGAMMDAVGQQREAKAQQELDAQIAQYYQPALLQQAWIMQQLQQLGLMPGAVTTSNAQGTNPQGSLLGQILGAAAQGGAKAAMAG